MQKKISFLFLLLSCVLMHAQSDVLNEHSDDLDENQTRISSKLKTTFVADAKFGLNYVGLITITNTTNEFIYSWRTSFRLNDGQVLKTLANALLEEIDGQKVTVRNRPRNGTLRPGQTVAIGVEIFNPKRTGTSFKSLCTIGKPIIETSGSVAYSMFASSEITNITPFSYDLVLTLFNRGNQPSASWQTSFTLPQGQTPVEVSDGTFKITGNSVAILNNEHVGAGVIPARDIRTIVVRVGKPVGSNPSVSNVIAVANGNLQTAAIPAAPVLNAIAVDPNNQSSFAVSWNTVPGTTNYVLQQDISSAFSNPVVTAEGYMHSQSYVNQPNGTYYFRVSATNKDGNSAWSNVQSVTVNLPPISLAAPALQAINNPSGASSYQLNWGAVANAQGYNIQESQDPSFGTFATIYSGANTSFQAFVSATGTYYYRVNAVASNSTSPYSTVQSTVVTQTPQNIPIIDGYWESWNSQDTPTDIVNMKVDVINISFANFTSLGNHQFQVGGVEADPATLAQLISLAHAAGKKVKLSVGGATYPLQTQLKTVEDAQGMAVALQQYLQANSIDGVDLDIEDSTPASLQVELFKDMRALMPNAILTYAPETPAYVTAQWDMVIQNGYQYMTYLSIQDYNNYQGYSYQQDIEGLMAFGVPAQKINVGLMPGSDDTGAFTPLSEIVSIAEFLDANGFKGMMFWDLNRDFENITGLGPSAATNTAWNVFHP